MDYVIENRQVNPNRNGYGVYGTLHHELKKIDSKKFIGVWRREACGNCNEVNCQCTFPWPRFMTTVLALCEETTETLELFATQAAEGTHSLTIHRYADLKDGKTIAEKIKRYAVIVSKLNLLLHCKNHQFLNFIYSKSSLGMQRTGILSTVDWKWLMQSMVVLWVQLTLKYQNSHQRFHKTYLINMFYKRSNSI